MAGLQNSRDTFILRNVKGIVETVVLAIGYMTGKRSKIDREVITINITVISQNCL